MKSIYEKIITFLFENYCGVYSFKLFGKYWTAVKASRILFPFFLTWGITKLFQVNLEFTWLDGIFFLLFIIQYIALFTMIVYNEYERINEENEENER